MREAHSSSFVRSSFLLVLLLLVSQSQHSRNPDPLMLTHRKQRQLACNQARGGDGGELVGGVAAHESRYGRIPRVIVVVPEEARRNVLGVVLVDGVGVAL